VWRWLAQGSVNSGRARRQQENPLTGDLVDGQRQKFQRRRIDPVQILKDHHHRLLYGELIQLAKERS
jgi:hypothetical protein